MLVSNQEIATTLAVNKKVVKNMVVKNMVVKIMADFSKTRQIFTTKLIQLFFNLHISTKIVSNFHK